MNSRIEQLLIFLEEDPSDAFSRYALALEYVSAGRKSEAVRELEYLLENHPDYLAAYYQLGQLTEADDPSKALEIYRKGHKVALTQNDRHTAGEIQTAIDQLE